MLYHASQVPNIKILKPAVSNHEKPLIYLSEKRQNTLVYLSNAVEKHCMQTGFLHNGKWKTWASYGFTNEGILRLDEYYPNATKDTYSGVPGYIYSVTGDESVQKQTDIPYAYTSAKSMSVTGCEYIEDVYIELLKQEREGKIMLTRYEDNSTLMHEWIRKSILAEYEKAGGQPDYRHFLKAKFTFL